MTPQDTTPNPKQTIDGAVQESREPLSGEPSGRSHRDGLSAAPSPVTWEEFVAEMDAAERKAFDSLSRYKFQMFGYWAAIWVHLNRLSGLKRPNPFKSIVHQARIENVGVSA